MSLVSQYEPEKWHRAFMEVIWTDSGKFGVRFTDHEGRRVTQHFRITPEETQQLTRIWKAYAG